MAVISIEYFSEVLEMEWNVTVLYPDASRVADPEDTDIPVLYVLHGMNGNHNSWIKRTAIERLTRSTNLILVFPNTSNGWYTNTQYGYDYYTAVSDELPRVLQRFFPNMSRRREKTFIEGLSMGGYGSFLLALKSNRFSYAASLSGALSFHGLDMKTAKLGSPAYWQGIFGEISDWESSAYSLETAVAHHDGQTSFWAWCGEEDLLYPANLRAVQHLKEAGVTIRFSHSVGKHEWYYWEKQMEQVLQWLPISFQLEERLR